MLHVPNENKKTPINLKFTCSDGRLSYPIKHSIHPIDWNKEAQRAKTNNVTNKTINKEIERLSTVCEQYQESCRIMAKEVLTTDLKYELNGVTLRTERKVNILTMFDYMDMIIADATSGKLLKPDGKKYTAGSLTNWKKGRRIISEFNPNLTFEEITLQTYHSFIAYCNNLKYTFNYTGDMIKILKRMMKIAMDNGWHTNIVYLHKDFKKLTEESFQIYLNDNQILSLYEVDLSARPSLETIRDRFIINTLTGFRVSDMKTISVDDIQNEIITQVNQKTGKKVAMPVHKIITDIIKKYDGKMPKQYAEAIINREIKTIGLMAGLTDKQTFTKTIGGTTKTFVKLTYQMITNHTARRTMATNMLKEVDAINVMPVMGMSMKTLIRYNKKTPEENAENLKKNPYFNK